MGVPFEVVEVNLPAPIIGEDWPQKFNADVLYSKQMMQISTSDFKSRITLPFDEPPEPIFLKSNKAKAGGRGVKYLLLQEPIN
jgi:hypothetical protein